MATKKELEPKLNKSVEKEPSAQAAGGYSSAWQEKMDGIMTKIAERKPFSYDPGADALYKQHEDRYISGGRMAMQDTIGKAATMTGGYGNSYAQGVGQQAHQEYMKGLTDKIPELYELAYSRYADEGDALLDQYGLYADREAQDYSRYLDDRDHDYRLERDRVSDRQWQDSFDLDKAQLDRENALKDADIAASLGDFSRYEALGYNTSQAGHASGSDYKMSASEEDTLLSYLAEGDETGDFSNAVRYFDVLLEKGVPESVIERYMAFIPETWLDGEGLPEGTDTTVEEDAFVGPMPNAGIAFDDIKKGNGIAGGIRTTIARR